MKTKFYRRALLVWGWLAVAWLVFCIIFYVTDYHMDFADFLGMFFAGGLVSGVAAVGIPCLVKWTKEAWRK